MSFLRNRYARILTLVLLLEGTAYYAIALRPEMAPSVEPLSVFPTRMGGWQMAQDVRIEQEMLDVLKADDTLNRSYQNPARNTAAYLFIAYFKTQRYGQSPHSPKNCLPGAGWEPVTSDQITITVPGRNQPIVSNRFVVAHGEEKSVVLYWYQSHSRIIANEYSARLWLVADSIKYHRSDSALVRIVVPVIQGDTEQATQAAVEFVQAAFPELARQLPA